MILTISTLFGKPLSTLKTEAVWYIREGMKGLFTRIPRLGFLMAGVLIGSVSAMKKSRAAQAAGSVKDLESRLASKETVFSARLVELEKRVEEHEARLKDIPSIPQILTAMEELLNNKMSGLDQRLSAQVRSIEVLKTTVSQTDELLERVLESIDSLRQPAIEGAENPDVPVSARG